MTPPDTIAAPDATAAAAVAAMPAAPKAPGPRARARKYYKIFRVTLVERLTYRADFLFSTFLRFLPMLTTILLWDAIYAASRRPDPGGFTRQQTIAYLLLVNISRMFSSMPGLAGGIARDIREGAIKKYLIQPVDMVNYLLSYRIAHKAAYIISSALPYAVLFFICRRFFYGALPTDPLVWLAYFLSLVLAFLVGFFFEAGVGMVGFWFLEVTSLLYIVMSLNFFISGHMLPLDMLPRPWSTLLKWLPFQYMAYFPAVVLLGKVRGRELAFELLREVAWVVAFALLCRWLFRRGLKRYSAFGG